MKESIPINEIVVSGNVYKARLQDAGIDIIANCDTVIRAGSREIVTTGLHVNIPLGYVGKVFSRSGLSFNHGIEVGAGVIDCGYTGEVKVNLYNHSDLNFSIKKGNKIAQLVVLKIAVVDPTEEVSEARNDSGFGSTGI